MQGTYPGVGVAEGGGAAQNSSGSSIAMGVAITVAAGLMTLAANDGTAPNSVVTGITTEIVPDGKIGSYAFKAGQTVQFKAGAAVALGDKLMPETGGSGKWIKVTTAQGYFLRSIHETTLADGEYGSAVIEPGDYKA